MHWARKFYPFTVLVLGAVLVGTRLAAAAVGEDWKISPLLTARSEVRLSGAWPQGFDSLTLGVRREGLDEEVRVVQIRGPRIDLPIYLRDGRGPYEIRLWATKGKVTEYAGLIKIANSDEREHVRYRLPSEVVESRAPEILQRAQEVTAGASSDYERVRLVHDWVAKYLAYDTAALVGDRYLDLPWNALSVLARRRAVCTGYSTLAVALLRAVGIPARVMRGWMGDKLLAPAESKADLLRAVARRDARYGHAWVEAYVRDPQGRSRWVMFDATSDSGTVEFPSGGGEGVFSQGFRTEYFDPAEEVFNTYYVNREPIATY